jgi:two-component system, response regulator PdtaR
MERKRGMVLGNEKFLMLVKSCLSMEYSLCTTLLDAKTKLRSQPFNFLIILYTQNQSEVLHFAKDCAVNKNVNTLMICKQEIYDQVQYQIRDSGILLLSYPVKKQSIYQALCLLENVQNKILQYERKYKKLEQRYLELKIVDRCKLMLISNYNWSEEKAHHYIEKLAMDTGSSKYTIAKKLLEEFEQS